jgi:two-component sensor histidine kinase
VSMQDASKPKEQLIQELMALRQRTAELEASEAERKRAESQREAALEALHREATHKATLLQEVNHRVKNNLLLIKGLLQAELHHTSSPNRAAVQMALDRLSQRIDSLAEVHTLLSQSEWAPVCLSELVERVMGVVRTTLQPGQQLRVDNLPSPIEVSPRQAGNLALVIYELVTNTFKYALGERLVAQVALRANVEGDQICLEYRDDGPGYPESVLRLEKYDVGLYLVQRLVGHTLRGTVQLANDGGAVTRLRFKVEEITRT